MIIKNIKASGFDRIYDGYKYCFKDNRSGFGDGFINFLQHAMISIDLDDISSMELFYLKRFSSSVHVVNSKYSNFIDDKKDKATFEIVRELLQLQNEIYEDNDINPETDNAENIIPIGCKRFHLIATFTGPGIINITGLRVETLFLDEDNKFSSSYIGNMKLEERIGGLFYQSFYRYMSENMSKLDIVTDFIVNKKLYQYSEDYCSLAYVNSPYGELNFFGSDQAKLNQQIQHIKSNQQKMPYILDDSIYFTFIIKSTFSTFFNIYLSEDNKNILDYTNLKIVFIDPNISLDKNIFTKYNVRISQTFEYMGKLKQEFSKRTDVDLNEFNYIFFGNTITYSLKYSLDELNHIEIENRNNENGIIYNRMKSIGNSISKIII